MWIKRKDYDKMVVRIEFLEISFVQTELMILKKSIRI